jgi:hypothetical protein
MNRQKRYYQRNKQSGLVRVSVWIRDRDREDLRRWLEARGLQKPASERKQLTYPDHPEFDF